ncbi:urease accessory protein UreE [Oceanomicrobium pacificus]|uniref:Urease accessory protein UreE n=1 Tax=Oceanomicrobium pacificus TaxID=2692916 RepID=A0A6B0TT11_9RHOB|nr:urease accessory protein UreE [Oceanomicrobium pacificus]MXU65909.1 urease accessory protein UreE [Oceanomicrobium pacificus]
MTDRPDAEPTLPRVVEILDHGHGTPDDIVRLAYDDRTRRRVVLTGEGGLRCLLDQPEVTWLQDGNVLVLDTGQRMQVTAEAEPLMRAECEAGLHLVRCAWHVGNRHLPCEIHETSLLLRWDHVIAEMLEQLGARVTRLDAPFNPEGGAYGTGRTHGHSH